MEGDLEVMNERGETCVRAGVREGWVGGDGEEGEEGEGAGEGKGEGGEEGGEEDGEGEEEAEGVEDEQSESEPESEPEQRGRDKPSWMARMCYGSSSPLPPPFSLSLHT